MEAVPSKYERATDWPCARSGKAVPRKPTDDRATYLRLVYASSPNATGPPEHRLIHNRTDPPMRPYPAHTCRPRQGSAAGKVRTRDPACGRPLLQGSAQNITDRAGQPNPAPTQTHSQTTAQQPHRHQRNSITAVAAAPAPQPRISPTTRSHTRNPKNTIFRVGGEPHIHPIRENDIEFHPRPNLTHRNLNRGAPANANEPPPANTSPTTSVSPAANTPPPLNAKSAIYQPAPGIQPVTPQRAEPVPVISKAPRKTLQTGPVNQTRPPPKPTHRRPPSNLTVTGEAAQPRAASTARRRSSAASPGLPHSPLPHPQPQTPGFRVGGGEPHIHPIRETGSKFHPRPNLTHRNLNRGAPANANEPPPANTSPTTSTSPAANTPPPLNAKSAIYQPAPDIQPVARNAQNPFRSSPRPRAKHYRQGRSTKPDPHPNPLTDDRPATSPSPEKRPSRGPHPQPADAPAPQPRVSPTPRSHTRNRKPPDSGSGAANPTFTRSGKRDRNSTPGPTSPTGTSIGERPPTQTNHHRQTLHPPPPPPPRSP